MYDFRQHPRMRPVAPCCGAKNMNASIVPILFQGVFTMSDKTMDLAGPGISTYEEVASVLPQNYNSLLTPKQTMKALFGVKNYIEEHSGVNDMLDRDGSRTPVEFPCGLGLDRPIDAQVVQAATKWKRMALKTFDCDVGEGICTDMKAVRKDYFLDHDHSAYVDQWDWEKVITNEQRNLDFLTGTVKRIWKVIKNAELYAQEMFPQLRDPRYPSLPDELTFIHAEDILSMYPDLPRKQRETKIIQEYPAVFIYGIGWPLEDGYPHEMRAADYDDWITETVSKDGRAVHGLNGDILVWNPVTQRRHELTSMGVRVTKETLRQQLEMSGQLELLKQPYHQAILNDEIPLSIGGGIGQSRVFMLLLKKAHLGEVSVSVWPKALREISEQRNIHLLH
jgi:aspartate--ammonia ligase